MSRLSRGEAALQVRTHEDLPTAIRWGSAWQPIAHIALALGSSMSIGGRRGSTAIISRCWWERWCW